MSLGNQSPCDPHGHHGRIAAELERDELRLRCQRAEELIDARLKRTRNASGFIRRLRAVLAGGGS